MSISNDLLSISVAGETDTLVLLVGTGVSRHLTNNNAPNWVELLLELIARSPNPELKQALFTENSMEIPVCNIDLKDCAHIIEELYRKNGMTLKNVLKEIIEERTSDINLDMKRVLELQTFIYSFNQIDIITTNYDRILAKDVLKEECQEIVEGKNSPRVLSRRKIYYIHGNINYSDSIVLTMEDYHRFIHNNGYINKKIFTLIQEKTVVILGYSLADININLILTSAKNSLKTGGNRLDIFYISKDIIDESIKTYYHRVYGIKVIDNTQISDFIHAINLKREEGRNLIKQIKNIDELIKDDTKFKQLDINDNDLIHRLLIIFHTNGMNTGEKDVMSLLLKVLISKKNQTGNFGAWSEYYGLADWLCELATIIDFEEHDPLLLDLVKYSLEMSSKNLMIGKSWDSFVIWKRNWNFFREKNKVVFSNIIRKNKITDGVETLAL